MAPATKSRQTLTAWISGTKQMTARRWLKEAQREELPQRIRADAAFDAAYMYSRVAMAGADEELRHPHPAVLTGAAERLGWSLEVMATAMQYLGNWYSPLRGDNRYDELLAIALRIKAAVDTDIKTQA